MVSKENKLKYDESSISVLKQRDITSTYDAKVTTAEINSHKKEI
jgi:hypothetical protein